MDIDAGVIQFVIDLLVILQRIQHPGLCRGRVGGIRGNGVIAMGRNFQVIPPVIGNQFPVCAFNDIPVFGSKKRHGRPDVRDDVYRFDRHIMFGRRA